MFGHFLNERVGLERFEIEECKGVDSIFKICGKEDSFVVDVLLNLFELISGCGFDCCTHNS